MEIISANEALKIVTSNIEDFGIEEIDFMKATNRVLKETIVADRDFPPFNRVSMDGIAISSEVFNKGQRIFKIEGVQAAGGSQLTLKETSNCMEVMTGAILPKNADTVIQYELISIKNGMATITIDEIKDFQNVHLKGFDKKQGDLLISKNTLLSSAEIGVLATVGKAKVKVAKQPKVMIVATGDELVDVSMKPEYFQIRKSNVYTLVSLLETLNIQAESAHILDDKEILFNKIKSYLNEYDVLLFSGAVSKGKFDFLPGILEELGVKKQFHKVQQRPGKPFWFGKKDKKTVFAFPGNPVSTFVSCLKYFYPWFQKSVGLTIENNSKALLAEDFYFKPDLTYFLQVKLKNEAGILWAYPIKGKGSGDLANLVETDAFLEIPDDRSNFTKGEALPILVYRNF